MCFPLLVQVPLLLLQTGLPPRPWLLAVFLLHGLLPPMRLEGGILRLELLLVFDDTPTMGEVEALAIMLDLECLQSLKCLQMNCMQAYWQMDMEMDMQV